MASIYDELRDIGIVEGAGLAARAISSGLPQTRAIGAVGSGLASYQNELAKTRSSNMPPFERYGRAGLVGLADGIYDLVPFGNLFKKLSQSALRYGMTGLSRLGSDVINNRAMDTTNDYLWR